MIRLGYIATGLVAWALPLAPASAGQARNEIVQPLPSQASLRLNAALRRLAANPADFGALLEAGEAAIDLDDVDAALGFFGRAAEISPGDARVKIGTARAFVRSRRPVEALRLFAEAESAGTQLGQAASDRGLAFDLVGDNASAQQSYRLSLTRASDDETLRRLALSQAMSGDKAKFEATLLPLLRKGDLAAFRTRAFGLALLGETEEAVKIAEGMMPRAMAARMTPYLRYMPRLTRAQQAAAGNLGVFPRAANIGTDDAQIAGYANSGSSQAQLADARLEPRGEPLGTRPSATTPEADPRDRRRRRRPDRTGSGDARPPEPTQTPASVAAPAAVPSGAARPSPQTQSTVGVLPAAPPVVVARADDPVPPSATAVETASESEESVADAFAWLETSNAQTPPARRDAVDITAIAIPREVEKPDPPKPIVPQHPARHWVQVATGRDVAALRFDWRRIVRKADGKLDRKGPFVTPWGQANRLLAGPFESPAAAREMVNALKELGLDSFPFSSDVGQEIKPIG